MIIPFSQKPRQAHKAEAMLLKLLDAHPEGIRLFELMDDNPVQLSSSSGVLATVQRLIKEGQIRVEQNTTQPWNQMKVYPIGRARLSA